MSPKVSVVIPTRNRAQYILQTLDSVFAQTYKNYEVIVVDDGSTDSTRNLLAPLIDQHKIHYVFQDPQGVSAARNRGISEALGSYIAFLDSDDLFLPLKLEKQIEVFSKKPSLGFVHCWFAKFDEDGRDLGVRNTSRFVGKIYPQILLEWSMLMAMPCMLMRADVLRSVGGFDIAMNWAEDLDLWNRIARSYSIGIVDEPLVKVRVHATSTSFDKSRGSKGFIRYLEKAFDEDPGLSPMIKRRAQAKMYAKLAQNLLGEGGHAEMKQARTHSWRALKTWPLQIDAGLAWFASFLPQFLRKTMASGMRSLRYPSTSTDSL